MSALFTSRDLSGHKVMAMNAADARQWVEVMGEPLKCEGGCTVHHSPGAAFDLAKCAEMFGAEHAAYMAAKLGQPKQLCNS